MHFLLRILTILFFVGLICHFFYSLGRRSALNENKKKPDSNHNRKKVDSNVVEEDEDGNNRQ